MRFVWLMLSSLIVASCGSKEAVEDDETESSSGSGDEDSGGEDKDLDGVSPPEDCDDTNASVKPGAPEIAGNLTDDDCDGEIDEVEDEDLDGFSPPDDCDDTKASVNPDAPEIAGNGIDDDCDGEIDEVDGPDDTGDVVAGDCDGTLTTVYIDYDFDGFGTDLFEMDACLTEAGDIVDEDGEPLSGWVANADDCDDTEAGVYPGATELCDDLDNDCDSEIDEGVKLTVYRDIDGDGFGDSLFETERCEAGDGFVANGDDCDDNDPLINPDATELCDGVDNNCLDGVDEGFPSVLYTDLDGDGYGDPASPVEAYCDAEGAVADNTDCDDSNPDVNPGATEECTAFGDTPVDEDCNGEIDDVTDVGPRDAYLDYDGDGYGDESFTLEVDSGCIAPTGFVFPADETGPFDCNDSDASAYPGATEVCDGIDNDCDILVDEPAYLYTDADGDGYGDPSTEAFISPCSGSSGLVGMGEDCDDSNPDVYPGAEETYDCIDNDCDLEVDEGFTEVTYADLDGDGFGDPLSPVTECGGITGVADMTDCDDTDPWIYPGSVEICDGIDNDCDLEIDEGLIEEAYLDLDGDGFGDPLSPVSGCDGSSGGVSDMTDCDDSDPTTYPGAEELCDDIDNDCDFEVDETDECASTCGDGVLDPGEEVDPPDSEFSTIDVDPLTCRWDFSEVEQLFCNSGCSWAGAFGCDGEDADVFCKLRTGNPLSVAESYTIESALGAPGFPCPSGYPTVYTDRGIDGTVYYTDLDLLTTHGSGDVITNPVCTDP